MRNLILLCFCTGAIGLFSCGDTTTTIDGSSIPRQIDIVHKIDFQNIEDSFYNECEELYQTQEEIDLCVDQKISELIDFFNGVTNDNQ